MTNEQKEKVLESINSLQHMATEFRPDEGVLEESEEKEIDELIDASFGEDSTPMELKNALSKLIHFCGEWFPDEWFDEEELEDFEKTLAESEELKKVI